MTNILLINVHSSCNTGDDALTLVTLHQLRDNFPDCQIILAFDDPAHGLEDELVVGSLFHWVKPSGKGGKSKWRFLRLLGLLPGTLLPLVSWKITGKPIWGLTPAALRPLLHAYFTTDLVVSKPGGFLYSSGKGLVFLISIYSMAFAIFTKKPFYIFPQSIGPIQQWWERSLLKWLVSKARIVMAREEISYQLLTSIAGSSNRFQLLPDPAFACPEASAEAAIEWLNQHDIDVDSGRPLLGVTVVNWMAENPRFQYQDRYEAAIAAAARDFINQTNGMAIFFTQVWGPSYSQDDRIPSKRIITRLQDVAKDVIHIQDVTSPPLLKAIYGCMDVFLGTRMHSNIFALSQGVPVIAIGYQPKTKGILRMLNLDRWMLPIQDVDESTLPKLLSSLFEQRDAVANSISIKLPAIIEKANLPGRIVAQDFQKLKQNL
jgi:colanic acid/amylovoran biosynthesis protein